MTPPFLDALGAEVAVLQAQFPELADALGRALVLVANEGVFPEEDGRSAMVRSSDGTTHYFVHGSCQCPADTYRQEPCKHRLALRLYQRVCDRLLDEQERYDLTDEPPPAPTLRAEWMVSIQGKPFVRFEGLLALAHEQGLVSLETGVIQANFDLAICQATAVFQDGSRYTDIGDATPDSVAKHLRPHFIRMAATRASARALRRALYISACSVEELGDEVAA